MSGYTKLFHSILASTVWEADMPTRIVWITMLAMADKFGTVDGSVPGLATLSRVSIEQCEHALAVLSSPDAYSRSKESDGRRIEAVDGGWRLINHAKYRQMMNSDERREYLRIKQQEHRDRVRQADQDKPAKSRKTKGKRRVTPVNALSIDVALCREPLTEYTHAEAEASTEADPLSASVEVPLGIRAVRPPVPLVPADLIVLWNDHKSEKQKGCTILNGERANHARQRLRDVRAEVGQAGEREFWLALIQAIRVNPYCNGENDRGWIADFDYLLRQKTWVRFVEKTGWFETHARNPARTAQNAPRTANGARAGVREANVDAVAVRDIFTPEEPPCELADHDPR